MRRRQAESGPADGDLDLVLRPLAGRKAKPVRFLVPQTLPVGKVVMFAGVGGMGKSTISRHLIACLTAGRPAFGLQYDPPAPCDVALASVEDSPEDTILPHLLSEGADLARVQTIDGVHKPGWKPGDKPLPFRLEDVDAVIDVFTRRPSFRLLVIDPIMSFVGRSGVNENASAEVRRLLDPLLDLADRTGVTVLLIAHLNKANNVAAVNRIVGTAAFRDACRIVYVLGSDPGDDARRVLAVVKENVPGVDRRGLAFRRVPLTPEEAAAVLSAPEMDELTDAERADMTVQLARVEPGGRVDIDADEALGTGQRPAGGDRRAAKREGCLKWLLTFLARYAYPRSELFDAAAAAGFTDYLCYAAREAHNRAKPEAEHIWQTNRGAFGGKSWWGVGNYRSWTIRPDPNQPTGDAIRDDLNSEIPN